MGPPAAPRTLVSYSLLKPDIIYALGYNYMEKVPVCKRIDTFSCCLHI